METTQPSMEITFDEDEWQKKTVGEKVEENRNVLSIVFAQLGELRARAGDLTVVTDNGPSTPFHVSNISHVAPPQSHQGKTTTPEDSLINRDWIRHLRRGGGGGKSTRKKKKTKQKQRRKRKRKRKTQKK
tara:strand:+ start:649 stop:1038 length:390 start_codon:yes stop_codon:yes gene_type:complete